MLVGLGNQVHCYLATRPEVQSHRVQSFVVSKGGSKISLRKAHLHLLYTHIAYSMHRILKVWRHISEKITLHVIVRGDSVVTGEGRVVGVPKFHSWGKCTMPLTNVNSDWMSQRFLWTEYFNYIMWVFKLHLGGLLITQCAWPIRQKNLTQNTSQFLCIAGESGKDGSHSMLVLFQVEWA